ncbi:MAG: ABC transporter permease, partial [Bacteroidetes bacterium]|nr:ABC transporter permease [Bacteroidota bacterium]
MILLLGAITIGLILSLLSLGVFISFRIFSIADITVDGSLTLGGALSALLITQGVNPWVSALAAFAGGMVAGSLTGILHTRFKINALLAGILVMTALYSVNLHIMGKSNIPILGQKTMITSFESLGDFFSGTNTSVNILGWMVQDRDASVFLCILIFIIILSVLMVSFFKTHLGTSMRATGNNPQMIRALGANTSLLVVFGLAISNGLVALSGCLLAQYQGFADVQMGIGMVVLGLASVIIGESLVSKKSIGFLFTGVVMGTILFRM